MLSKQICKELYGSTVLSLNVDKNSVLIQFEDYDEWINIHELIHACKLKALQYGYEIVEYKDKIRIYHKSGNYDSIVGVGQNIINFEVHRVFKAFQWILDNKA